MRLTRGPAGNRTTTGSLSATQECRNTNWATRTPTLGTPAQQQYPPLNSTLAQRTKEEWARTLCENKAVAIIQRMQEGKPALIPKECEEILIAIVLDRPLKEAQRLVENPERFFNEILEALETHRNHPVLMQFNCSTISQVHQHQALPAKLLASKQLPQRNSNRQQHPHNGPSTSTTVPVTVGYSWLAGAAIAYHQYHLHHLHHWVGGRGRVFIQYVTFLFCLSSDDVKVHRAMVPLPFLPQPIFWISWF